MMFLRVAALAALTALVSADQQSFDCPMRQLALDFAAKAQPFRPKVRVCVRQHPQPRPVWILTGTSPSSNGIDTDMNPRCRRH